MSEVANNELKAVCTNDTGLVIIYLGDKEVGMGIADNFKEPYFGKFYLNVWAYAALFKNIPWSQLFPWKVAHFEIDKYAPYLRNVVCVGDEVSPERWPGVVSERLAAKKS